MRRRLAAPALLVILVASTGWTRSARAQEQHSEQHERQHETMEAVNRNFGAAYDALDIYKNFWTRVQTRLDTLGQMAAHLPAFEIEKNQDRREEFDDFAEQFAERVKEMKTAVQEEDLAALEAKVIETGMLCSRCHKAFRPTKK